jgi:hypothetical protein
MKRSESIATLLTALAERLSTCAFVAYSGVEQRGAEVTLASVDDEMLSVWVEARADNPERFDYWCALPYEAPGEDEPGDFIVENRDNVGIEEIAAAVRRHFARVRPPFYRSASPKLAPLVKNRSFIELLERLERELGPDGYQIRDYWQGDLIATGVASREDEEKLVYVCERVPGERWDYDCELAYLDAEEDEYPPTVEDRKNVGFEELVGAIRRHFARARSMRNAR